ncbi:TrmH family RNA methyltransferase [Subsaxibacter sp. CAU 1640]|uniref:TrmH family RNA methyltransferase n=1 Tax=Subsaxibacter sp. CAU 1640 TaxID=2933271 RepID=UPI0020046953|nr:TrmH family RNA methyltransferase [Subsaxibacter sp. CAU 1640]MCK7590896.1 TrmH family RNA methyltransferase [Subsaxibacter sp. CAU 1640]
MQKDHYSTSFSSKQFPIILVCDNITKAPNIGSLFRTADAFGVEKLIFCGQYIPIGRRMTKTSRSTEKFVNYETHDDIVPLVTKLKSEGYKIVSLEITTDSKPIHAYNFHQAPLALIIGDENHGISADVLIQSDDILHIDMFGYNSSMNVVQAATIALYEITKQLNNE